jgi:hypothetical protein
VEVKDLVLIGLAFTIKAIFEFTPTVSSPSVTGVAWVPEWFPTLINLHRPRRFMGLWITVICYAWFEYGTYRSDLISWLELTALAEDRIRTFRSVGFPDINHP